VTWVGESGTNPSFADGRAATEKQTWKERIGLRQNFSYIVMQKFWMFYRIPIFISCHHKISPCLQFAHLQLVQLQAQRQDRARHAVGLLPGALRGRLRAALGDRGRIALRPGLLERRQQLAGVVLLRTMS